MVGVATITTAPASIVTGYGVSCIKPSATSMSSVLVQEPVLKLLSPDAHGTHTLLKTVFNVVLPGLLTCRFEARRNIC
jgi:hypothetical protein